MRNGGRLLPVSVIQGPGHSFINEDPTIFMEDLNTTCARVARPRQFPSISLPTCDTTLPSQQEGLSLADIQLLHNTTGNILTRQLKQPPISSPSVPPSIPSSSSSDTLPALEVVAKTCPICQKVFREYTNVKPIMSHATPEGKVSSVRNVLRCWAPKQISPPIRKPFISLPTSHALSASLPPTERQKCQNI